MAWCYHNSTLGVQLTASALLVIVLELISSPFCFLALGLCSISYSHSGFCVSGTRSPNNKEMLWLSFVIVLLIFPFMFILNMNISSWEVTMWRLDQQKQIQEFLGAIPKVTSKIMIRSRYTVKLIKLSFTLLGYSVPSHTQYCICYFALFSLKIPELELTIIIIRPSLDHVNDVGGHCPWRPLMMSVSLSLFSFILTHHFLNSSLFSFLWLFSFSLLSHLFFIFYSVLWLF